MLPIFLALVFIAVLVLIFIIGQPDEFKISRSMNINAPPEKIFSLVNDLHEWEAWSPWAKLDPNVKNSFEGPPSGVGTAMKWEGNNKVGTGRMTLIENRPDDMIRFRLEFEKPMKATNLAEFTFVAQGDQTVVTWMMFGKNGLGGKLFGLIVNCDKMVGKDFEKGLMAMKAVAEVVVKN